jgi:hypothetical protein
MKNWVALMLTLIGYAFWAISLYYGCAREEYAKAAFYMALGIFTWTAPPFGRGD